MKQDIAKLDGAIDEPQSKIPRNSFNLPYFLYRIVVPASKPTITTAIVRLHAFSIPSCTKCPESPLTIPPPLTPCLLRRWPTLLTHSIAITFKQLKHPFALRYDLKPLRNIVHIPVRLGLIVGVPVVHDIVELLNLARLATAHELQEALLQRKTTGARWPPVVIREARRILLVIV